MTGPDLLRTFEVELRKSAQEIQACLLALDGATAPEATRSLHEAYRLTHSVKGAARVVGLASIEEMAHALEDRLQVLVREQGQPSPEETTAFLHIADGFIAAFDAFLKGHDFSTAPYMEAFTAIVPDRPTAPGTEPAPAAAEGRVIGSRGLLRPTEEREAARPAEAPLGATPETRRDEFLSIPAGRVDELFRHVEEAFLVEARVSAIALGFEDETPEGAAERQRLLPAMRRETTRLHQVLLHLHEVVRLMRMEPLDRLRVPLQRAVRDLGASLQKDLRFTMHGRQEMVDASILDALHEPLLHLVRNAVDHGIEPAADREAQGKPRQAYVEVKAAVKGGALEIVVSDDGRGISPEKIRRKAIEQGIVSEEQAAAWTNPQWFELVFRTGFSTADEISAISGRGMGLDIVRDRLRGLGGDVSLASTPGEGTRFDLRVPIRLLTARTLLVRCGAYRAGLPIADVNAVFALKKGQDEEVGGKRVVRFKGDPLTLEPLGARLGWANDAPDHGHVVVVGDQDTVRALLVDEVIGEIEQPAVPPPANFEGLPLLSGVIVLGDGDIVPLLDAREMVRSAAPRGELPVAEFHPATEEAQAGRQRVLIVDDSPTVRALHRSVVQAAGYEVLVADDGVDALAMIERRTPDLVVTDVQMPRMDGLTLIRRIRERAAWRRLPIIVVSQYGRQEDLQKAAALGADRYVVKSAFKPEEFIAIIDELLGR